MIPTIQRQRPRGGARRRRAAACTAAAQIKHGARVIKLMVTGGVGGFERALDVQQFSDEEMRTVVEEARRNRLKVMAIRSRTSAPWSASTSS